MSDPTTAAAGNTAPAGSFPRPSGYSSDWDRNYLVMASALYAESYQKETGQTYVPNVHKFWDLNCVLPNLDRSAVPDATWQADPDVYGVKDAFLHSVPLIEFGPLRAFGSLQQLRNTITGGHGAPEDFTQGKGTTIPIGTSFASDRSERGIRSIQFLYKERMCDPEFKYTIEDAIGNPPYYSGNEKTDASSADLKRYDMRVPNSYLGESATEQRVFKGCGIGNDCEDTLPPSFEESSLYQFAYVTSSHDPDVQPGWHRLIHLKVWADRTCNINVDQTCRSYLDPVVQKQIYTAQLKVQQAQQAALATVKNSLGLSFGVSSPTNTLGVATNGVIGAFATLGKSVQNPVNAIGSFFSFGRRLQIYDDTTDDIPPTNNTFKHRRRLFYTPTSYARLASDGYFNIYGRQSNHDQVLRDAQAALRSAKAKPKIVRLNLNAGKQEVQATSFRTGRAMLFATRCSDFLHTKFPTEIPCCDPVSSCNPSRPYTALFSGDQCSQRPLEIADTKTESLAEMYLDRLAVPSPPPTPPPSPEPPPPPSPPTPPPPPQPPVAVTADQAKAILLDIQRRFCDSVYLLSSSARCSRLATELQQSFVFEGGFSPPSLPPIAPDVAPPPPPPSPPRPSIPRAESDRMRYVHPSAVLLSTYFVGDNSSVSQLSTDTGNLMAINTLDPSTRNLVVEGLPTRTKGTWAQCSSASSMADAPLPCRTGDSESRCISGGRHCSKTASNTEAPWLEVDMRNDVPNDRDYYFFAIEFTLPTTPQYASLLFQSDYDPSNQFYTVSVMDALHTPLRTQCKSYSEQNVDHYTDGLTHFQYVCLNALATDAEYATMRDVRYVRITLTGSYRMIWFEGVRVLFRTLQELPPSPPPNPRSPPSPPDPGAPPDQPDIKAAQTCTLYENVSFAPEYVTLVFREPCGLTKERCCELAYEHNSTTVFSLSASGCCTLFAYINGGSTSRKLEVVLETVESATDPSDPRELQALAAPTTIVQGLTVPYGFGNDVVITGIRDDLQP